MLLLQPEEPKPAVREPIAIGGKLRMRFYEPLVLLLAATNSCMHNLAPKTPEQSENRLFQSLDQLFHDFMNKLAQICDARPRGSTVTAVVALSLPDGVQYRFASNQRSQEELDHMKIYVTDVLGTLGDWTDDGTDESARLVNRRVLRRVVAFTRPRLEGYVKAVAKHSTQCLETQDLAPKVRQKLQRLYETSSEANGENLDEDTFFRKCSTLMEAISKLSRSRTYKTFRLKATAAQHGQVNSWAEMRHAAGRLLSYFEGVETLVNARSQPEWAQLFFDFEIVCLPSSEPHPNPIVGQRKNVGAAGILGRMTSSLDPAKLAAFQTGAEQLQMFNLDDKIRQQNHCKSFRPIVHAELLVHDSLSDVPGGPRYFEGFNYIGTSKPTCRLCDYYFRTMARTTGTDVQVRHSHGNLYLNWRAPDVYADRVGAVKQREDVLNEMIKYVRNDTYNTLEKKIGERKSHDSNTSRTYARGEVSVEYSSVVDGDQDDLASMMGGVSLED